MENLGPFHQTRDKSLRRKMTESMGVSLIYLFSNLDIQLS